VVLYQPVSWAFKKAADNIDAQYSQWLLSLVESGIIDALQWQVLPDNSDCLPEDSAILIEKTLDIESLATSAFEESQSEAYATYSLKGSQEEVIFYEECVETPPSLVLSSPSLVLEKFGLTSMHQWLIPWLIILEQLDKSGNPHKMIPLDKFDLCIAVDLKTTVDELIQKHGYKLKDTGPLKFYLGCDFFHDPEGML